MWPLPAATGLPGKATALGYLLPSFPRDLSSDRLECRWAGLDVQGRRSRGMGWPRQHTRCGCFNSCLMLAALKGELNLPAICSPTKYTSETRRVVYLSELLYLKVQYLSW